MKAYIVDSSAPSGVRLGEAPDPQPKANETLIQVQAVSLNHGELTSSMFSQGAVAGWDSAGRVIKAAADGSGPKEGESVVGWGARGAWAEKRAVPTDRIATLPNGIDVETASTLPVAGGTALRSLRQLGAIMGKRVLITGASGGVGAFALQLAKIGGAWVAALASSPQKKQELVDAGADEAIASFDELREPVDGVIELVGGQVLTGAWDHLRTGGTLVSIGFASMQPASFAPYATVGPPKRLVSFTLNFFDQFDPPLGHDFRYLAELVAAKRLDSPIVWRGTWDRIPEALDLLGARKISGKAVLTIG